MIVHRRKAAAPVLMAVFAILTVSGAAILAYGAVTAESVFPTSAPVVDCSTWPSGCTVTVPVSNTGTSGFTAPFTAYFVYKDSLGQTVLIDSQTWTSQASLTDSGFTPASVPGAGSTMLGFSVNVFFMDANGAPMGSSASSTFSVPLHFTIDYCAVGSITVSPPGSGVTTGAASGLASGCSYYEAYWPSGTTLTVTTSSGVAPVTTSPSSGDVCPASGTSFVCTLRVSESTGLPIIEGAAGAVASQDSIVVQSTVASTPVSICLSASPYTSTNALIGACAPTGSFSLTVPSGYTWSGNLWSVTDNGATVQSGNSTSVSLSYSALSPKVAFSDGIAMLQLTEAALVPVTPSGSGSSTGAACTLSPSTNAGLKVLVVSMSGSPLSGAFVTAAGASGITNNEGVALLCNFPVPGQNALSDGQGSVSVTASDAGYSTTTQNANVIEGQTSQTAIKLSPSFGGGFNATELIGGMLLAIGLVGMGASTMGGKFKK